MENKDELKAILAKLKIGEISNEEALEKFKALADKVKEEESEDEDSYEEPESSYEDD